ncbi:hypothetical protein CLOM_g3627 [Closterium sp. NIES-68]|nr:hypothetical protein CLOM_g3627 [Closterium sp. NIES-68]GJP63682.1 hypothetical protein CLOP_g20743 [Closterium sp. NIES-67]
MATAMDPFPSVRALPASYHMDLPLEPRACPHPPRDQPLTDTHLSPPRAHPSPIHKRKERSFSPPSAPSDQTQARNAPSSSSLPHSPPLVVATDGRYHGATCAACDTCATCAASSNCVPDDWPLAEHATPRDMSRPLPDDFRQRAAAAAASVRGDGAGPEAAFENFHVRSLASEIPPTFWETQRAQKQRRHPVPHFRGSKAPVSPLGAGSRARERLASVRESSSKSSGFDRSTTINGGDAATSTVSGVGSLVASRRFLPRTWSGPVERPSRLESLFMRSGSAKGKTLGDTSGRSGFFTGSGKKSGAGVDGKGEAEGKGNQRSRMDVLKVVAGGRVLPRDGGGCDEGSDESQDGHLEVPEVVSCFWQI